MELNKKVERNCRGDKWASRDSTRSRDADLFHNKRFKDEDMTFPFNYDLKIVTESQKSQLD